MWCCNIFATFLYLQLRLLMISLASHYNDLQWGYSAPTDGSWYWKKICSVKGIITRYYSATKFSSMRQYSVKAVYQKMTPGQHRVLWDNIIWCRLAVPNHKFISWLSVLNRLKTRDRLFKFGVCDELVFPMCAVENETHEHTFFCTVGNVGQRSNLGVA